MTGAKRKEEKKLGRRKVRYGRGVTSDGLLRLKRQMRKETDVHEGVN